MEDRFDSFGLESPFSTGEELTEDFDWRTGETDQAEDLAWLEEEAPWAESLAAEPNQATPLEGGLTWTERYAGLDAPVTCFLSPAALQASALEVLIYVHGLLDVCGWPKGGMQGLIASRDFPFAKQIAASGRPILLVVPQLQSKSGARWNAQGLDRPAKLGGLVAAAIAQSARQSGVADQRAQSIILAGHSRAYSVLYAILRALAKDQRALAAVGPLSAVWMLDASYHKAFPKGLPKEKRGPIWPGRAIDALKQTMPALSIVVAHLKGSITNPNRHRAGGLTASLFAVPSPAQHCTLPGAILPTLLAGVPQTQPEAAWKDEDNFADQGEWLERETTWPLGEDQLNAAIPFTGFESLIDREGRFEGQYSGFAGEDEFEDEDALFADEGDFEDEDALFESDVEFEDAVYAGDDEDEWEGPAESEWFAEGAQPLRSRIVETAKREWEAWNRGTLHETNRVAREHLAKYWRRYHPTTRSASFARGQIQQRRPWSAAFISYVMNEAGAGGAFAYAAAHTKYIAAAKAAAKANDTSKFTAWPIDQVKPEVGDLVCRDRQDEKTGRCAGTNFRNVDRGGISHADIVVEVGAGYAAILGGNTGQNYPARGLGANTAGQRKIRLDDQGRVVADQAKCRYFAIMKPPGAGVDPGVAESFDTLSDDEWHDEDERVYETADEDEFDRFAWNEDRFADDDVLGEFLDPRLEGEGWAETSEQIAFRDRVLAAALAAKRKISGSPLPNLDATQLGTIRRTRKKARKDTAAAVSRLLEAAAAQLKTDQASGEPDALGVQGFTVTSGYRSREHQLGLWQSAFKKYYRQTQAKRENLAGGPHSLAAVDYLLRSQDSGGYGIPWRVVAPGYSNHQAGLAVDFMILLKDGKAIAATTTDETVKARWRASWFHKWLKNNATSFGFEPYSKEEWHWVYKPDGRVAGEIGEASSGYTGGFSEAAARIVFGVKFVALLLTGERDETRLTNEAFAFRHPERAPGQKILSSEKSLIREWLDLRDKTVRPLLARFAAGSMTVSGSVPGQGPAGASGTFRKFRLTTYHLAEQKDFAGGNDTVPILDAAGNATAHCSPAFFASLALEGSGILNDGRLIGVTSGWVKASHDRYKDVLDHHDRSYAKRNQRREKEGKPPVPYAWSGLEISNSQVRRVMAFTEKADKGAGYGVLRRIPLVPFRTLAADIGLKSSSEPQWKGKGGLVPPGTKVFISEFKGMRLPDGTTHDGWLTVNDTGGAIFGAHFDVFVGTGELSKQLKLPSIGSVWFNGIEQRIPPGYEYGLNAY